MLPELYFHGVGTSQLVFTDGSFVTIDKSQDLQIQVSSSEGKIQGGDGVYDLMTFITEKTGKLSITDAEFQPEQIKAATGAEITTGAEVLVPSDKKLVATGACALTQTTNIVVESVVAKVVETGAVLVNIGATGTPKAGEFTVTAAGVVAVNTTLNGKNIEFSYFYTDSTGTSVKMLEDDMPKLCEFRHTLLTDEMADGKRYKLSVRVFKCKPSGAFTYDAKRGAAFAPKVELTVLDAGRADKQVLSYNISEVV